MKTLDLRQKISLLLLLALSGWANAAKAADGDATNLGALSLEQLIEMEVEGAALHPQSLGDAPASVTIISAAEISKYGYRTLGEALASVRGFNQNYNRTYHTVGARGFNLPSDYGSRILVLVNGHNMADNIFDSMLWFGEDFPIDLKLMQRIEVIRGPSSALYGSSGLFATINIITKSPDLAGPVSLTLTGGSFGEKKVQAMGATAVGANANLLFSGSVFNNSGEQSLYFPGYDTPQTGHGIARRMDGEKGYHFFANLVWKNWNIIAVLSDRNKTQPVSWGPTIFNDRGTHVFEDSNYVEGVYVHKLKKGTLKWRSWFSDTRLNGRFDYASDQANDGSYGTVEDNRTFSWGDWLGTSFTWRGDVANLGTLTAGIEGKADLRAFQGSRDVNPVPVVFVNIDRRDQTLGLFLQDERRLSAHWKMNAGVRIDASHNRRSFISPRAALIYQPSSSLTYKFLYGRAFRNPSAFDLFYSDGLSSVANPAARPEKADTVEVDVERKIGPRMTVIVSAYGYVLRDFLEGVYSAAGLIQTQNSGHVHARGLEVELNGKPTMWLEIMASYAVQHSTDDVDRYDLENSPDDVAKLRVGVPLGQKFFLSGATQYYSSRLTMASARVPQFSTTDFTIVSRRLLPNMDVRFGLRNSFNTKYFNPIALDPRADSILQPGRSVFFELTAHRAE